MPQVRGYRIGDTMFASIRPKDALVLIALLVIVLVFICALLGQGG